ncbi:hypothetical protein D3C71_2095200 [compost metagenome]
MPAQTNRTLMAMAMNVGCCEAKKKMTKAPLTMAVTMNAAERTYIRQKMQDMTVIAM